MENLNDYVIDSKLNIGPLCEDDFETVRKWHIDMCLSELSESDRESLDMKTFVERIDKILIDTAGADCNKLYVASIDGKPVGFILMGTTKEFFSLNRRMFIYAIYADPRYRGLGVGRALMEKAQQMALEEGMNEVWFTVSEHNSAVGFYENLGYKTCRRTMIADISR